MGTNNTFTGGKKGNKLVAGAVYQGAAKPMGKYGGSGAYGMKDSLYDEPDQVINQASAIADYDFGVDEEQKEIKFETVSHACATSVANARIAADLTQGQLAKKCNEKAQAIVALENGTARYSADLINRIERALGVKINRGRKK